MRGTAALGLACLALLDSLPSAESSQGGGAASHEGNDQRLAVLLPIYSDRRREGRWPTRCAAGKMAGNIDLVLYVSHQENAGAAGAGQSSATESRCFGRVRTIYGGQVDDNKDSSAADMLYSAFLDRNVRSQLHEYDALAVIPSWDVVAATATTESFGDALYDLAFPIDGQNHEFWVKHVLRGGSKKIRGGSSGSGREAIRGDVAIYNNVDVDFVSFVYVAREQQQEREAQAEKRWGSVTPRSFGEALSLTLEDPLYEEHAPMFVAASLASSGSGTGGESTPTISMRRELDSDDKTKRWKAAAKWKKAKKWQGGDGVEPKWQREEKWRGDSEEGIEPKWRREEKWTTKRCDEGCTHTSKDGTRGRVCDWSCDGGDPYGTNGCSAKDGKYGMHCRACFNDVDKARARDTPDNRAIMCNTLAPPSIYTF